jgi:hypothetical protein
VSGSCGDWGHIPWKVRFYAPSLQELQYYEFFFIITFFF